MKTLRLLTVLAAGGLLTLSACTKNEEPSDTSTTTAGDGESEDEAGDFGDDTTDDGNTMFIPEEDLGSASTCDPWMQDCMDGEKCVAYASSGGTWDANKCVPVMGDGQPGDECTYDGAVESTDTCGEDSWCWDVSEENLGTCTSFCTGSPDNPECDPGTSCSIANTGSINLCLLDCNPLLQDCPADGTSCFWEGTNFVCANATSNIPTGDPCGFINDCEGGNVCLAPEALPNCMGASCCVAFCDLAEGTCIIDGTECTAFYEENTAPPGLEDVGVCIVPGA